MSAVSGKQIDAIIERHAALQARMATGDMAPADFVAASKEFAELEPVAKAAAEVTRLRAELVSLNEMLADPEMKAMAEEEIAAVEAALPTAEHDLAIKLLPKDVADERAAMLEIRAGTGGDEAALFAGDLLRMYSRYADAQGWKVEIISANEAEVGGYKEVVASVVGQGVFAKLKFESGVHRIQRVPVTESGGRIHTSAATAVISSAAIAFISGSASIASRSTSSPRSRTTSRAAAATGSSSANSFDAATKSAGAISPVAIRACRAA